MTVQTVKIAPEVAEEIRRILAEIPDLGGSRKKTFTVTEDALILAGWGKKSQLNLARRIGCAVNTMRQRYLELTEGRGK